MQDIKQLTTALVDALAHLGQAQRLINLVLNAAGTKGIASPTRIGAAVRTTSTQILAVLAQSSDPLTLIDIADGVVALRRGEDEPRKNGGTRYQELCRTSLGRLIERGLVERVEPTSKKELMRFQRTAVRQAAA